MLAVEPVLPTVLELDGQGTQAEESVVSLYVSTAHAVLQAVNAELSTDPHTLPSADTTAVTLAASPIPWQEESLPSRLVPPVTTSREVLPDPESRSKSMDRVNPGSSVIGLVSLETTSDWERARLVYTRSSSRLPLKG